MVSSQFEKTCHGATKYEEFVRFENSPHFVSTYTRHQTHCGCLPRLPVEMAKVDEHTLLSDSLSPVSPCRAGSACVSE